VTYEREKTMTDRMIRKGMIVAGVAMAIAALPMTGCTDQEDDFRPDHEMRSVDHVTEMQSAVGARADGMLYAHHFDGNELNSLGKQKLDLMTKTGDQAPLTVYLSLLKNDATITARTKSVQDYLAGRGLASSSFKVEVGPNPASHSMAQPGIARLGKTESPGMGDAGGDAGGSTMAAAPEAK
jgi:hypothetical protein